MTKLLEEPEINTASGPSPAGPSISAAMPGLIQLFRLLADETRLRILRLLIEAEEYHVRALCEMLGQSQPAVSHHLALLREGGLIACRRQGKHNFYRLSPGKAEEVLDLLFDARQPSERRVRLGKYVLSSEA